MQKFPPYFRYTERFRTLEDFCTSTTQKFNAIVSSFLDLTTTEMENPAKLILEYSTIGTIDEPIDDESNLAILHSLDNWRYFPAVLVTFLFKNAHQTQKILSSLLERQICGSVAFISPLCEINEKQKIVSQIAQYFRSSPKLYCIYFEKFSDYDINFIEISESLKYLSHDLEILIFVDINPEEDDFGHPLAKSLVHLTKLRIFELGHCDILNENLTPILKSLNSMDQRFECLTFHGSLDTPSGHDDAEYDNEMLTAMNELENKSDYLGYH